MTKYTLTVACSKDGFISRSEHEAPQTWASEEEQALFFRDVEAADWAVMGRHTHEAADRPDRRRIVFSTTVEGWQRPTQLWVNPDKRKPSDLSRLVSDLYPLENGLILGGTRVHDWFLEHRCIDRIHLTIEPIEFGGGLPIISNQTEPDAVNEFISHGYHVVSETRLNDAGTRYVVMMPK